MIFIIILMALQLIPIDKSNPPIDKNIALHPPKEVESILKKACYDCHSNETKWPFYANIAPLSFSISSHVKDGRKALNFSEWKNIDPKIKTKRIQRAIKTIKNGMMPLPTYLWLHDEAKLTKEEKRVLTTWLKDQLGN
jgi:uncharacterized membrane protein